MEEVLIFPTFDGIGEDRSDKELHLLEHIDIIRNWIINGQICIVYGSIKKIVCSVEGGDIDVK